jgi:hypothetical protein
MPKLDPDDQATASTTSAPAPLPAGQTSTTSGFGSTPSSGFGSSTQGGFGATTNSTASGSSGFGGSSPSGFGSSATTGTSSFGASSGGFGGASSFGGQQNNFVASSNFGGQQGQYQQTDTRAFTDAIEASEGQPEEHWMQKFWRPMMGWLYMLVCFCDFIAFPILWGILQAFLHQHDTAASITLVQWNPITLQGAGLFHLAMGAILGIAAYGRTKEKTTGTN